METRTATNDPGPRPVAPLLGKNRSQADNTAWTAHRKKVKKWNLRRFPRETLEQRRTREMSERVAEFHKALYDLADDRYYGNLPSETQREVLNLLREAPVGNQIQAWLTRASLALGAARTKLQSLRSTASASSSGRWW